MKYPAYPSYKASAVDWLEDVPEHWDIKPLKRAVNFIEGPGILATDFEDEGVPLIRIAGIGSRIASLEGCNFLAPDLVDKRWAHFRVQLGDLLISGSASTGFCSEVDQGTVGAIPYTGIMIIRPKRPLTDKRFIRWFFLSDQFLDQAELSKTGSTIQHFGPTHLSRMTIVLPSPAEQRVIADFLDAETSKVDTLLTKKRELIEKLKEKRTVLISRTVTQGLPPEAALAAGLNPNPKLKPSGFEWLGEIPEHWEVCKFSHEIRVAEGQVDPEVQPYVSMLLIAPNHIESATGRLLSKETAAEQGAESGKYLCRAGEVIYSKIRPALAKATVAPEDCLCSADMYPLTGSQRFENHYICWLFLSQQFTAWSVLEADRVAMPKINRETLSELRMPVPPIFEQRAMVDYLDCETNKMDRMIAKVEEAVERSQEYRTALITAAVTGKIDVREAVVG